MKLQERRKQAFIEDSNRNRTTVEKQMKNIHASVLNSTQLFYNKVINLYDRFLHNPILATSQKFGNTAERKSLMRAAGQNMLKAARKPMTQQELVQSRGERARAEGRHFEPKENRESLISRQLAANHYSSTYNRIMATNPGHTRVTPKEKLFGT